MEVKKWPRGDKPVGSAFGALDLDESQYFFKQRFTHRNVEPSTAFWAQTSRQPCCAPVARGFVEGFYELLFLP